jgi:hypothetical protein
VDANPVNFTDPSGKTLTKPNNTDWSECISSQKLQGVDTSIRYDVCHMIPELETAGYFVRG